mgnify:FL=1
MTEPTTFQKNTPAAQATCAVCGAPFPSDVLLRMRHDGGRCPACGAELRVALFPAAAHPAGVGTEGTPLADPAESPCFFHDDRRAVAACVRCGRFVCALCELPMPPGPYCPECLNSAAEAGETDWLKSEWQLDGTLALAVAAMPLMLVWLAAWLVLPWSVYVAFAAMISFLVFPALVTAPIAMFLGFRARGVDSGPFAASRWPARAAILLGLVQIGLLVLVVIGMAGAWL